MNWESVFPLGILFAIAGGILGVVWASLNDDDNKKQAVAEVVIASNAGGSFGGVQVAAEYDWVCAAGGGRLARRRSPCASNWGR